MSIIALRVLLIYLTRHCLINMKISIKSKKGFTLIELLVVISIIGLLSSVILAFLVTARISGQNSSITLEALQIRNQLEIDKSSDGSYGADLTSGPNGLCNAVSSNANVIKMINNITNTNGGTLENVGSVAPGVSMLVTVNPSVCFSSGSITSYAIYSELVPSGPSLSFTWPSGYFCVDSTGKSTSSKSSVNYTTFGDNGTCI